MSRAALAFLACASSGLLGWRFVFGPPRLSFRSAGASTVDCLPLSVFLGFFVRGHACLWVVCAFWTPGLAFRLRAPPRLGPGVRLTLNAVFCLFFSDFCPGPHLPLWRAYLLDSWSGFPVLGRVLLCLHSVERVLCSLWFSGPPFRPWALSEFWADSSGGVRPRSPSTSCSFLDSSGVFWASVGSWAFAFVPPSFGFPVGPSFWLL